MACSGLQGIEAVSGLFDVGCWRTRRVIMVDILQGFSMYAHLVKCFRESMQRRLGGTAMIEFEKMRIEGEVDEDDLDPRD